MIMKKWKQRKIGRGATNWRCLAVLAAALTACLWLTAGTARADNQTKNDASLGELYLYTGNLTPAFSPDTAAYINRTEKSTTMVKAVPNDSQATLSLNGTALSSGKWSPALSLNTGTNTLTIMVTAADGLTTRTYTVTVIRPDDEDSDTNLMNLALQDLDITPAFSSSITSYAATTPATSTAVKAEAVESYATIRVNNVNIVAGQWSLPISLKPGSNAIAIVVVSKDKETSKTYTITVNCTYTAPVSQDANLSMIKLTTGPLTPAFPGGVSDYSQKVENNVTMTTLEVKPTDSNASVAINGRGALKLANAPLEVGDNIFTIKVASQDSSRTRTYTVTVKRAAPSIAALPAPVVSSITPASGPESGYTRVEISGSNFAGALAVRFGGTAASGLTINDDTSITVFSPPGSGTVDVTVVGPDASSETDGAAQFTYVKSSQSSSSDQKVLRFYVGSQSYVCDGIKTMDAAPRIVNGRTFLPISYVTAALGGTVDWNQRLQKVAVSLNDKTVELTIGQSTAWANGSYVAIDPGNSEVTPIISESGRTLMPVSFIGVQLGCRVEWDKDQQMVTITYTPPAGK